MPTQKGHVQASSVFKATRFLAVAVAILLMAAPAAAQFSTGTILGVVTDATRAVIPGVSIRAINPATALIREALTNESGNYRIDQLPLGSYTVEVELPGFKKEIRPNTRVEIDTRIRMDFTLTPGNISEIIEVNAQAPLVQTEDSSVGQVVEERKIVALPLNGRDFSQLAYIVPGTFAPRPGSSLGNRGGFAVAGLDESTNQFLLDGVNNNGTGTMEIAARINVDTVGEFKVQTGMYAAQYGRYAGAQVDVVTKSGTNQFHGSGFAFTRNDNLDARNFFDPWPLESLPEFKRHQYGGTIGGPIKRDKAFFFVGYQGQRQAQFITTAPTVPQPELWSGNLSQMPVAARDPQTGQPFPGNMIPVNRIHPISLKFRQFWPNPSRPGLSQNASALLPSPDSFHQPNGKIDWRINENHTFVGSYNYYNNDLFEWPIAGRPQVPGFMTFSKIVSQGLSLSEVWTISPTVINEFRAGFGRVRRLRQQENPDKNWNEIIGIPGTAADTEPLAWGVPFVQITGFARIGDNTNMPQPRVDQTFSVANNVSVISGNHALKFGADFFLQHMNLVLVSNGRGTFQFTGNVTGNPFADFLLGFPAVSVRQPPLGPMSVHPRRTSSNAFFQDDWKAAANLTFNIGVRYEWTGRLREKYDKLARFDPTLGGGKGGMFVLGDKNRFDNAVAFYRTLYPNLIIERGSDRLFKNDTNNIAPRFGFAWTPKPGTVLRGAYGIFYQIDDLCSCDLYQNPPFNRGERFTNRDRVSWNNPWGSAAAGLISMSGIDPNVASPYYQQSNLGIQHEFTGGFVGDVSWQMKKGTKLTRARDVNQPLDRTTGVRPYPLFSRISFAENSANSIYHGLHTRLERRTNRSETFLIAYIWGKMIDDATSSPQDSYNLRAERAVSADDVRHRFSASYVLPLPFGSGAQGLARQIINGWELSGIFRANSGSPVNPQLGALISGTGNGWDRPNLIGNPNKEKPAANAWWDKSAFATPARGSFGNAGRNILIGPGVINADVSLMKNLDVTETHRLQFRFEFFNLLNHTNFDTPASRPDAGNFGSASSAAAARQIQLGLKYFF